MQPLINEKQLSELIGLSLHTLRRWRVIGEGPRFIKIGSCVRYDPADIAAWLNARKDANTREAA